MNPATRACNPMSAIHLAIVLSLFCEGLLSSDQARAQTQLPASVGSVTSDELPIEIFYNTEANAGLAGSLLATAETSYRKQVNEMGFAAPVTVDGNLDPVEGIRFYLVEGGGFGGMGLPIKGIDTTPNTDCATVALLADDIPEWYYPSLIDHEFNHTVQMAVDCTESAFAFEQITVAVESLLHPRDAFLFQAVGDFQASSWRALYHVSRSSYYHFGAALYSYFLDKTYGTGDGTLLARIWSRTGQRGTVEVDQGYAMSSSPNEPDLIDAMRSELADAGVAFEDAFTRFAISRYFVGSNDDGQHLRDAGSWVGAEPTLDHLVVVDQLPQEDAGPLNRPEPLGVSYIGFDPTGAADDDQLRLSFSGGAGVAWRAVALVITDDRTVDQPFELDERGRGKLVIPELGQQERVVLVAVNLGNTATDPDETTTTSTPFFYSARLLACPDLVLDAVSSSELEPGMATTVTLEGSGFPADQEITVASASDDIEVVEVIRRSSTKLDVLLRVAADAPAGGRNLEVRIECGASARGVDLLRIQGAAVGCGALPRPENLPLLLALLALLCAGRVRREGPGRQAPERD